MICKSVNKYILSRYWGLVLPSVVYSTLIIFPDVFYYSKVSHLAYSNLANSHLAILINCYPVSHLASMVSNLANISPNVSLPRPCLTDIWFQICHKTVSQLNGCHVDDIILLTR